MDSIFVCVLVFLFVGGMFQINNQQKPNIPLINKKKHDLIRRLNKKGQIKCSKSASICIAYVRIQDNIYHTNSRQRDYYQRHSQQPKTLIKITNLHYSVTKQQLHEVCQVYGKVKNCRIEWDKMGRSNEKATVEYYDERDAELAVQELQKVRFEEQGMELTLTSPERMPPKRHEIKKNYTGRHRQFNHNKYHYRKK